MNKLNKVLWGMVKIATYCLIVGGIIGFLTVFIVIPQWVKSTEILVPNLVGKHYYQALNSLSKAGLEAEKTILKASSSEPIGSIVVQDPRANISINPHHTVKLTVSIGPDLTPVPSVIGKSRDTAYETLKSAGFRLNSVAYVHSTKYLLDTVIAQSPSEGSQRQRGSQANILVSLGRKPQQIKLPDLKDLPVNEVLPALEAIGLNVEIKNSSHPRIEQGRIISHEKLVQSGDLITLEVSGIRDETENSGKWLTHKHTVSEGGNRSLKVKIVVFDDYSERDVVDASFAPGAIIDLEKRRVKVFGPAHVIVFEDGKKLYERRYQ
jgi:beta-lactam-binding protein with PASTA domain